MIADALLAWLHFLLVFSLFACLFAEACFYRPDLDRPTLDRLRRIDLWYGIFAGAIVASGIARVFVSPKGPSFYVHNPVFWLKMGLFLAVALLSIPPTLHFIALGRKAAADGHIAVARRDFTIMRAYMLGELTVFALIPACAAFMARGFGYAG